MNMKYFCVNSNKTMNELEISDLIGFANKGERCSFLTGESFAVFRVDLFHLTLQLIKPLILYCSVTWTSCWSHDNISRIFRLQKRCARIILDVQQRLSTVDLFNTLGGYTTLHRNWYKCTIAHKRIMGAFPLYMNDLLRLNNSQHNRNTRGANYTILPKRFNRAKEGGRTFSATTTKCWNHLPLKLRASSSVNILKNAMYKHFKLSQQQIASHGFARHLRGKP